MVEGILIWGSQHRERKANCHNGVERQNSLYSHTDPFQPGSKYPPVTSRRDRSRYAAVFQDQYEEFLELQRQVEAMQAKLQQLEALLLSLPPPRSQKEVRMAAHVRREFEKKRVDPGFLDKQARCDYLKGKLRHLKAQIRKFDDQRDSNSEDSVYF